MSISRRSLLVLAVIVLSAAAITTQTGPVGAGGDGVVTVGALLPLTGDAAAWGDKGRKGIELAAREVNRGGGIRGREVRVLFEDSRADPKTGVAAMKKLVTVDRVPVVIGDIVSAVTLPVAAIAESQKVVLLSPTASAPAISDAGDYVFRIWPSDLAEGREIATFAIRAGFKSIAILHLQNDYGLGLRDAFTKTVASLGGRVTGSSGYKADESDFRSHLTKLAGGNPDALYVVSYYKDGALAIKQARELGLRTQVLATTAIEDPKFLEIAGSAAEGLIYPLATGYDADSPDDLVRRFRAAYREAYGTDPEWVAAQAYDAMRLVTHVMQQAGFTGPSIQNAMARIRGFPGVTGDITFDDKGDVVKPVVLKVIQGGKFEKLKPRS